MSMNSAQIVGRVVSPVRIKNLSSGQQKAEFSIESQNPLKDGTFKLLVLAYGGMASRIDLVENEWGVFSGALELSASPSHAMHEYVSFALVLRGYFRLEVPAATPQV